MPWPSAQVAVGDVIQASQLNLLPIQIADSTLLAGASSFDFTSLPGQFAHLLFVAYLRTDQATDQSTAFVRFNNDSGANYLYEALTVFNANTPSAGTTSGQTSGKVATISGGSAVSNTFSTVEILVPHYAGTANNKNWRAVASCLTGSNGTVDVVGGRWQSNTAISRVTILPGSGNFVAGSRATIYGLA